jgi:glycosyltransferase involved in cell wall biosynthesis
MLPPAPSTHSFSLVLPCYNEEENIAVTIAEVAQWMQERNIDGEIIVVDDGSTDTSASILQKLQQIYSQLRVVTQKQNTGYGVAIVSGLDTVTKDVIGFMDSDRQFKIEDIELLLPSIDDYAFVAGRRKKRADSWLRNLFGKILGLLTFVIFRIWIRDVNCGMKVFRRNIWGKIRPKYSVEKLFNTELFLNLRYHNIPWKQVSVPHFPRTAGTPTGASIRVILRMFWEYWELKTAFRRKERKK